MEMSNILYLTWPVTSQVIPGLKKWPRGCVTRLDGHAHTSDRHKECPFSGQKSVHLGAGEVSFCRRRRVVRQRLDEAEAEYKRPDSRTTRVDEVEAVICWK